MSNLRTQTRSSSDRTVISDNNCPSASSTRRYPSGHPPTLRSSDPEAVVTVRIQDLLTNNDSPRLAGESAEHAKLLAESAGLLPPVLVHRPTMRVIDGAHRLRAAKLRGQETIQVRFIDGADEEVFVRAVQANASHGLPLTMADRTAAAARILKLYPSWSDKAVAAVTGLAATTVAAIRKRAGGAAQVAVRIGRDGRARPLDAARGRLVASEIIAKRPNASLREIAREAGVSPSTVRDVRIRMQRGDDPIPKGLRTNRNNKANAAVGGNHKSQASDASDALLLLQQLGKDPSIRYTDAGRKLWRFLYAYVTGLEKPEALVSLVPAHCASRIAQLARQCADSWLSVAEQLEAVSGTAR